MISASKVFNSLFQGLSSRQKEILTCRFDLEGKNKKKTLAALGSQYGITRERVRQIESASISILGSKAKVNSEASQILEICRKHLKSVGGIERADRLIEALKDKVSSLTKGHIELLVKATGSFDFHPEDEDFYAFYYLNKDQLDTAKSFINKLIRALEEAKEEVLERGFENKLIEISREAGLSLKLARQLVLITKKISENSYGDKGLAKWIEIRPKTIRDRIYIILKKNRDPLHFQTIAEYINKSGLGGRRALPATVHNELIKDERFVLVGRGIYALAEYGYIPGTAKDVIHRILKERGPMTLEKLIEEIKKERFFKPNTILANLQNKKFFERLEDGKYRVRET